MNESRISDLVWRIHDQIEGDSFTVNGRNGGIVGFKFEYCPVCEKHLHGFGDLKWEDRAARGANYLDGLTGNLSCEGHCEVAALARCLPEEYGPSLTGLKSQEIAAETVRNAKVISAFPDAPTPGFSFRVTLHLATGEVLERPVSAVPHAVGRVFRSVGLRQPAMSLLTTSPLIGRECTVRIARLPGQVRSTVVAEFLEPSEVERISKAIEYEATTGRSDYLWTLG